MVILALLLACGEPDPQAIATAPIVAPLDAPRLARRMSLDLLGTLPTTAELDAVEADPAALDELRASWLADPRFEERLVDLYQERWHTEIDEFRGYYYEFGLPDEEAGDFVRSIGAEPLRLIAHVIATDSPYTDIVTADWTMSNELLAEVFSIDRPSGEAGWVPSTYTDGRPPAGVLTTNGLWWRYISPINNYQRARSNAILELLVCQEIMIRPVSFSSTLSLAEDDTNELVRTDPACLSCHATLEPLAATLFGFHNQDDQSALEMASYHPEREAIGPIQLQVEPAWYGTPVDGLEDLGRAIALDSRFVDCGVQTMAQLLLRRQTETSDAALLREAREAFVGGDLRMTEAIVAITDADAYRAGELTEAATDEDARVQSTRRLLVASQLRSLLYDLSGFEWVADYTDQLDSDTTGYRILGGGVDGEATTAPQQTPGLTWALVTRRVAQAAALQIAEADLAEGASPKVLVGVTADLRPGDAAFNEALADLSWHLLAMRPSQADLDALTAHWSAVFDSSGSPEGAWASVLAVLLRDPDFLAY